jgi:hypothetical protein
MCLSDLSTVSTELSTDDDRFPSGSPGMTSTYAERTTQALTIQELITAIAGVQALITANVESPWCPLTTQDSLGKAYNHLAERLSRVAFEALG